MKTHKTHYKNKYKNTYSSKQNQKKNNDNRDFKIGDYGRLGRLDRCHVTQNTRDLLPSSFWDGMFPPGFSS